MAFSSLWSDVTDTNRVCDRIIIFPTILGPISRPGVLKIAENRADSLLFWVSDSRRQPNCSGRVAHVALLQRRLAQERNSLTTEWLSDWFKVTAAWHDGQSRRDRVTVREPENERKGWMKKSGERDCIFGSALPWPLAHFILLLSVLLLNAVPPTAAVVSFFIVWYKMRLNQRVNGFTRLHIFFGAVEFLRVVRKTVSSHFLLSLSLFLLSSLDSRSIETEAQR